MEKERVWDGDDRAGMDRFHAPAAVAPALPYGSPPVLVSCTVHKMQHIFLGVNTDIFLNHTVNEQVSVGVNVKF